MLLTGYAVGLTLAALFTTLAVSTRIGTDFLSTLTAMFNPLPAIALLPLALLWFGLGAKSLVFVIVHSVLWAVALNTHSGFTSVSPTLRMAGQNCGLRGISYVAFLLVPAAFPSILTGLKIGWAFAWRTLIAAELVFGVSSRSGGLGWFIFENRNQLEIRLGVRRPVHRHPDRPVRRERDLPHDRERDDPALGDAELSSGKRIPARAASGRLAGMTVTRNRHFVRRPGFHVGADFFFVFSATTSMRFGPNELRAVFGGSLPGERERERRDAPLARGRPAASGAPICETTALRPVPCLHQFV